MRYVQNILRWAARVLAALLALLILLFVIGEGPPPLSWQTAAFACVFVGLIVAWVSDLAGAALILGGMVAFYAIEFVGYGRFPGGPVFPLLYLPGVLLLIVGILCHLHRRKCDKERSL